DSGIGIPHSLIPKVFEHLTQLNSDSQAKREGSGLGLSICKRLADLMGAKITVESELGKGSTFEVSIPFVKSPMLIDSVSTPPSIDLKGKSVLLVDDNAAVCLILGELLSAWGAKVKMASN